MVLLEFGPLSEANDFTNSLIAYKPFYQAWGYQAIWSSSPETTQSHYCSSPHYSTKPNAGKIRYH